MTSAATSSPPAAAAAAASITRATRVGPRSGTPWIVTSCPAFAILGGGGGGEKEDGADAIVAYRSPATSLRGLLVRTDEPICSLHIVVATESNGGGGAAPGESKESSASGDGTPPPSAGAWHHPDDGLPHVLEHMVFLVSRTHPHKGVLYKLANRCLADGTNAWTATDHTAYTLRTAGAEGAVNLMPVFADHVLFPTITDSGFLTEIHHVNGKGEDKGVVYCEMQGIENSEGSLVDRAVMDLLYPSQSCGYSAETGGKMANLRQLTAGRVRRYHGEYYTPDNALFVLSGIARADEFFRALDEVEALVLGRRPGGAGGDGGGRRGRPWIGSPVPPMAANGAAGVYPPRGSEDPTPGPFAVSFPSEDETRGTISVAWRGPPYSSRATWAHLGVLWDYLSGSASSPLQLAFVESDDPLCAYLGPATDVFTEGYHQVWFCEVDAGRMDDVVPLFHDVIAGQAMVGGARAAGVFDLARMRTVIRRMRRRLLESAERQPTSVVVDGIVRNFLYGPRAGEPNGGKGGGTVTPQDEMDAMRSDVDILPFLDEAEKKSLKDASYWQGLMKEYILDRPMAVVFGKPSGAMSKEIADKEKEREAKQAKDLGEVGLERLSKLLDGAMAKNEEEIPEDILTSLPVPDFKKVPSIPLFTARLHPSSLSTSQSWKLEIIPESVRGSVSSKDAEAIVAGLKGDAELAAAPFHADLTHIESAFVFAAVGIDTTPLTKEQRRYLPILFEILFKLPATLENGEKLSKEEFVDKIQDETVSYSSGMGLLGGSVPQMSYVSVQVENTSDGTGMVTAFQWIRRVLYLTNITSESVKTAVQRHISDIPSQIRHGPSITSSVAVELNYDPDRSNSIACNLFRQKPFLSKISKVMESGDSGAQDVVQELESIRKTLFQTSNMHAFVAANLKGIPKLLDTLVATLSRSDADKVDAMGRLIQNVSASSVLRPKGEGTPEGGEGAVCALSAIESGFLNITTPCIGAYDANRPSLLVAIEYLTALEGDFWVKLRGAGLTYGYTLADSTDSRLLKFSLSKCGDVPAAFEAASNIITDYTSGKSQVSSIALENAKSSLAYQLIQGVSTKLSAAMSLFVRGFMEKKMDYDRYLLSRITEVTADDVLRSINDHLVPIFAPSSKLAIACPTNKLDDVHNYFVNNGWANLKKVPEDGLFTTFGCDED